jgi:hypothetical protein
MHGTKKCSMVMYGTKKCSIVMHGTKVFYRHAWNKKVFHSHLTLITSQSIGNKSYKFIAGGLVTERIFSLVCSIHDTFSVYLTIQQQQQQQQQQL